jgi:hypothetical protein
MPQLPGQSKTRRHDRLPGLSLTIEVVSKASIGFKVKAERGVQPQEYIEYFEDWTPRSNTGFGPEGRF